jgi:hypothetical protein
MRLARNELARELDRVELSRVCFVNEPSRGGSLSIPGAYICVLTVK